MYCTSQYSDCKEWLSGDRCKAQIEYREPTQCYKIESGKYEFKEGRIVVIQTIAEKIEQRRRQIIAHSVVYYRFNDNIIDDYTFDIWSKELVELQEKHPEIAKKVVFAEEFKDFDGSTGYQFADNPWGIHKASQLLNYKYGGKHD